MYNYSGTTVNDVTTWPAVALIIAIAAGILVYFLFLKSKTPVNSNLQKLKDILDFKVLIIEPLLKIVYLILTIFIILYSFTFVSLGSVGAFLGTLIGGPIILRLVYELIMIVVMIHKNTTEISNNTKPKVVKKEKKDETEEK